MLDFGEDAGLGELDEVAGGGLTLRDAGVDQVADAAVGLLEDVAHEQVDGQGGALAGVILTARPL